MPRFSILIAAYNAAPFLPDCLRSIRSQTMSDAEFIFVDDCSTDDTLDILQRYARTDARCRILRTPVNSGQAVARNMALREARGEFTLILDADDALAPDTLYALWRAHEACPEADAIVMKLYRAMPTCIGSFMYRIQPHPFGDEDDPYHLIPVHIRGDIKWPISGLEACLLSIDLRLHGLYALRTTLFRRQPYDVSLRSFGDDVSTPFHYLSARLVTYSPASTYYYRQHIASCTHTYDLSRLNLIDANRLMRQRLEATFKPRENGVEQTATPPAASQNSEAQEIDPIFPTSYPGLTPDRVAQLHAECLRRCEAYCWYNFVATYREFLRLRRNFSPDEWRIAERRFTRCLRAMRPSRLPSKIWRHPSTFFIRPFALFKAWQHLLAFLKKDL
ncbi:MAG: glycosyltransferase family A protein [Bacteroidales bacterium]|nr:glycosyltransferase family A protein [Bacteroidales bacterium]